MPMRQTLLMELARKAGKQPHVEDCAARKLLPCRETIIRTILAKIPFGYCHVNLADANAFIAEHAADFGT